MLFNLLLNEIRRMIVRPKQQFTGIDQDEWMDRWMDRWMDGFNGGRKGKGRWKQWVSESKVGLKQPN
ncbi:hypothetical protein BC829DRAFT_386819 [Chytridium lagenaria]|nr:hypothetical protein BC829DRAFT_386819 [Chytridium lagenaria]